MATDKYARITALFMRISDSGKAALLTDSTGVQECWVPCSQMDAETLAQCTSDNMGLVKEFMVATWFVKKEGLDQWV